MKTKIGEQNIEGVQKFLSFSQHLFIIGLLNRKQKHGRNFHNGKKIQTF